MSIPNEFDIAIVGMSGRFPGAETLSQFWKNLSDGVESITRFSDEELLAAGIDRSWIEDPRYVKAAPVLEAPAAFDADFFHFSPEEARALDPQHRILLELAHEALEDAGYDPDRYAGRIGVFTGSALNTYFLKPGIGARLAEEYIPTLIGSDKDFLSTRIAYKLNLKGPSVTVQTACSTSMVAVHLARQSLLCHETDMVLAGGVSVRVPHRSGYFYDGGGVVSPDGRVRAFDASANGTVFGSGGGVLVLKRLADAISDGDTIHAVIKGSAVNNDGSEKAGYTAPSVNGQADAVVEALANAAVEANSISYLEAHGSGTPVGDPIEIRALTKAFRTFTPRSNFCAIGSVKTNVGHLDAAAAVTGIIKTVLALKNRKIPPSLNFSESNPEINFSETPFYVNTKLCDWDSEGPRRAGVMSTGMGGTNAHLVLEEAPNLEDGSNLSRPQLFVLSAKTESALDLSCQRLHSFLACNPSVNTADIAHTLQVGRKAFPFRRYVVCSSRDEALTGLEAKTSRELYTGRVPQSAARPVILLLPGVGDQYVGMAQELYQDWEIFRQEVDRCAAILHPHLGLDIRKILYPEGHDSRKNSVGGIDLRKLLLRQTPEENSATTTRLNRTRFVQPAMFTIEYALAKLWASLGVTPNAIVGHSMGEYVAACLSGVFSLEDALRLVATRAALVDELPLGRMLAVMLSEQQLLPLLDRDLCIALLNGPNLCVVAGPVEQVNELERGLQQSGVVCRHVQNGHAFHSPMLNPILDAFGVEVRKTKMNQPRVPFISNVTGTWITPAQATNPAYWVTHANSPARFNEALHQLWQFKDSILVEAGPGRTLSVLAMQHPDQQKVENPVAVSSVRQSYENRSDTELLWHAIGRLWLSGIAIKWDGVPRTERRRISLPTYPFERRYFWNETKDENESQAKNRLHLNSRLDDWFYTPTWERMTKSKPEDRSAVLRNSDWLVFADSKGNDAGIAARLAAMGLSCTVVRFGQKFKRLSENSFELNPDVPEDYVRLFSELRERLSGSLNIVHLGSLTRGRKPTVDSVRSSQRYSFYSLFHLAQAIGELGISIPIKVSMVSNQLHQITGEENLDPTAATVLGLCGVVHKEYPNITIFNLDLPERRGVRRWSSARTTEILSQFGDTGPEIIAYRGQYRWQRKFQPVQLSKLHATGDSPNFNEEQLRHKGVYLITGGTGGIGMAIAKYLAKTCQARLVLTKRSPFPEKSKWRELQEARNASHSDLRVIDELLQIESLGAEVDVCVADCTNVKQMDGVVEQTLRKYGSINGAVHSAGLVKAGLMQAKTRQNIEAILAPKLYGSMVLLEVLKEVKLDFLVLFSSINSILSPFALGDYSAANAYLDVVAGFANTHRNFRTLTINWPGWREAGQLLNLEEVPGVAQWKHEALKKAINSSDGVEAFRRVLHSNCTQVIVSPENLDDLLKESANFKSTEYLTPSESQTNSAGQRRRLQTDVPSDDVEFALSEIWSNTFGIEQIGVHENFFEIGGHSLLAARIVSRIERKFGKRLSISAIFQSPTIAELAATLRGVPAPHVVPFDARNDNRTALLWLGGGAIYRALARHLENDLAMTSVSLPDESLASIKPPYKLEDLAQCLAEKILEIQPTGPYFLGAWCLPGLLAYETARQLQLSGRGESLVALVDTPISIHAETDYSVFDRIKRRVKLEAFHLSQLWNMPRANRSRYLRARFEWMMQLWRYRRLKIGYNTATEDRSNERLFGEIQYLAALKYRPSPFACRVLFLQPRLRPSDPYWDLSISWKQLNSDLDVFDVPGDHTSMFEEPNVGVMAERILLAVRDMQSRTKPPKSAQTKSSHRNYQTMRSSGD